MRKTHTAPDWAVMIGQIVDKGLNHRQIGDATGTVLTAQMLRHYERGVQPLYWRGEAMIVLWLQATGLQREDVPTQEVTAPYRIPQGARAPQVVVNLPNWPPVSSSPPATVKPLTKRKQRGLVMA